MALLVVVVSSFITSGIQSSWGRVHVQSVKIPTQNGQWVVADWFKPRSATAEDPAPFIAVVPGFQRSKEALSNMALELARRGFVVASIDPYAQGASSSSLSRRAATTEGYGMFAVVDYVASSENLNYVDKSRIGATGHSAGGNAAIRGANYFGRRAEATGKPNPLHSVFVSGYVLTLRDDVLDEVRSNVGMSYAYYDEGAYRNELQNGDMRRAPEALRLVNSGLRQAWENDEAQLEDSALREVEQGDGEAGEGGDPGTDRIGEEPGRSEGEPRDAGSEVADASAAFSGIQEVELGRYYGEVEDRTLRVVHNERVLHPFQPYHTEATANQLEYFQRVFHRDPGISTRDQVWYWKELLSLVALAFALVAVVPFGRLMLETSFFRPLVHPVPEAPARPQGAGKGLFWGTLLVGILVAAFSFIPLAELSQALFPAASNREMTWFFPQRMNNAVMLWAILNGSLAFLLFWLTYRFWGKKHGPPPETWGARTSAGELWRTFLLAGAIFLFYYGLLFAVYYFFHVDYRFMFMGVRVFQPAQLILLAMYAPLFFIFFLSNSLRVNAGMRFKGQAQWKSMLFAGVASSGGLFLIVVIQYVTFAATGTVYWTDGWLYVNLLFGVVPMIFLLPYFHRYFFRMTGRIYLGPMALCMIFIMILLSNTVCYLPI